MGLGSVPHITGSFAPEEPSESLSRFAPLESVAATDTAEVKKGNTSWLSDGDAIVASSGMTSE